MTARDFCYWLQGFFELERLRGVDTGSNLTSEQAEAIRRHLALVFAHDIDPKAGPPEHQKKLDHLHSSPPDGITYRC